MADDKKKSSTLTDEDLVTSSRMTRRTLIAGAGVALGGAAIAGRSALAADGDKSGDTSGDAGSDKSGDAGGDKSGDAGGDKSGDAGGDKSGDAGGDKGGDKSGDKSKIEEGRDSD